MYCSLDNADECRQFACPNPVCKFTGLERYQNQHDFNEKGICTRCGADASWWASPCEPTSWWVPKED